jgi:superfamily I DNA/RNA helicase
MPTSLSDDQSSYPGAVERIFGPPGTGKTTYLAKRVKSTVARYGPESMLLASFSVTAAQEMASRFVGDGPRPHPRCIGTLHSHAFRQLDRPPVALDRKTIADWNGLVMPEWRVTPDTRKSGAPAADGGGDTDDGRYANTGDELLAAMDRLRATLTPREDWPPNVREFATRWDDWKRDVGAVDFSDMISLALERALDGTPPPGRPQFVLIDEAQDLTPLEVALALAWGRHNSVRKLVFGLDDDQAINRWRGGDPEPLLTLNGPDVVDHLLTKSYRVPESVRAVAEQWVRRLGPRRRDKSYLPRTVTEQRFDEHGDPYEYDTGEQVLGAAFHVPLRISDPRLVAKLVADVDAGHTAMVLATCTYMLDPLINNLRREGVPFHNPYRPAEGRWNPLGRSGEGITTTAERVRRYLELATRDWTGADMQAWIELVKLGPAGMRNGAKAAISRLNANTVVSFTEVADLFLTPEALAAATEPSIDWLSGALLKSKERVASYPLQIARMYGASALAEQPRIVVGTIHSVKGATSDIVYVSPDVSPAAAQTLRNQDGRDETIRQFYVALTRAYRELRVLSPATSQHVRSSELVPGGLEVFAR